jgi:DNA-binding YbaB/EbfC family protein
LIGVSLVLHATAKIRETTDTATNFFIIEKSNYIGESTKFALKIKYKFMFGDLMGMMGKLKETQEKVEAVKKRLDTVQINEQSNDGLLKVTITANRVLKEIEIDPSLMEDKEQLEDYIILTLNKAIAQATEVNETEIAAVAREGMPNIPGLDLFT